MPTISYSRVVHLSHVIDERIPLWPHDPSVRLETVARLDRDGYALGSLTIGEHSGTHLNTPRTFFESGLPAHKYEAAPLVVPAIVIDVRNAGDKDADYRLTISDITAWEKTHGRIDSGQLLLVDSGWQNHWNDPAKFLGMDGDTLHFPGIHPDAARFLIDERDVAGIGIDTHGVDGGLDHGFATNRLMLESNRIVLENLANLDKLPPTGATLVIGILRLREGTGSPAAVLGLVP